MAVVIQLIGLAGAITHAFNADTRKIEDAQPNIQVRPSAPVCLHEGIMLSETTKSTIRTICSVLALITQGIGLVVLLHYRLH